MKCNNCNKELAPDENAFISQIKEDCNVYCEDCAPENKIEIHQSAVKNVLAGRKKVKPNEPVRKTLGEWAYQKEIKITEGKPYEDKNLYTEAEFDKYVPQGLRQPLYGERTLSKETVEVVETQSPQVVSEEEKVELKLELEVKDQQKSKITFDYQGIKANVEKWAKQNGNLVVNDDNLKEMKSFQKDIASQRVKLDTFRKEVKKLVTEDVKKFEQNCKEIIGIIEKVEKPLKESFETFAAKERESKKLKVLSIIEELYETYEIEKENRSIEVTDRHLLKSTTFKAIREDIETKCIDIKTRQDEIKEREEEAKAAKQTQIDYIDMMVSQEERNSDVKLNKQKYLDQLELGTDVKSIVGAIVKDAQDILADREEQEQKRRQEAERSFEQETSNEPHIEVPNIVKNGEVYNGETGEHVGPSGNLFEEQHRQKMQEYPQAKIGNVVVPDRKDVTYHEKPKKRFKLTFEVTSDVDNLKELANYLKSNTALHYVRLNTEEVE